jgi:hypothetical protein
MRILLLALLFPFYLYGAAGIYFGGGVSGGTETFTVENPGVESREMDTKYISGLVKAGYGDLKSYAIEVVLGYGEYDANIYSPNDDTYIYFDISIIKSFDFDIGFYPFIKAGFGANTFSVERETKNWLTGGSLIFGGGIYVPIVHGIEVEFNVIYRDKSWQEIDMVGAKTKSSSYIVEPYFGINYRF